MLVLFTKFFFFLFHPLCARRLLENKQCKSFIAKSETRNVTISRLCWCVLYEKKKKKKQTKMWKEDINMLFIVFIYLYVFIHFHSMILLILVGLKLHCMENVLHVYQSILVSTLNIWKAFMCVLKNRKESVMCWIQL